MLATIGLIILPPRINLLESRCFRDNNLYRFIFYTRIKFVRDNRAFPSNEFRSCEVVLTNNFSQSVISLFELGFRD